jgi:hypothetical protein
MSGFDLFRSSETTTTSSIMQRIERLCESFSDGGVMRPA